MNFWRELPKPIIGLSPMDGVSDAPFRFITAKYGKPDVITTEFISVDGIAHGAPRLFDDFLYHEIERPVVAQVFGNDPELFYQAAQIICEFGFDGVDINMGCPAKSVSGRGAGAGLINNPLLARKIIAATRQGVTDWLNSGLNIQSKKLAEEIDRTKTELKNLGVNPPVRKQEIPVSVKTRIGYDRPVVVDWIENLLQEKPASIAVHGRTLKQMYRGEADWQALKQAAVIVKEHNSTEPEANRTTIILNGDITDAVIAKNRIEETGADGIYIGRGSYGDPWIFRRVKAELSNGGGYNERIDFETRAKVAIEHAYKHFEMKGPKGFVQMRKHLAWYFKGFPGASDLRVKLLQTNTPEEVVSILDPLPA